MLFRSGERNPRMLFSALADLQDKGFLSSNNFILNIIGNIEPFVQNAVKEAGIEKLVLFQGLKPPSQVYQYLSESNLLLVITRTTANSRGEMTTKLFEYIGIGRRILCLTKPGYEITAVLKEIDSSIVVGIDSKAKIARELEQAINSWQSTGRVNTYFDNGNGFSRQNQAKRLACAIQNL